MKYPETDSVRDLGRIDTAAHAGAVDDATKAMGYHKQNVTNTESILVILGGAAIQLRTEQSVSAGVEENALMQFSIGLMDVDSGAVASDDIDITGITATIEKSTGGGAFSDAGLTAITFGKEAGRVFVDYQFKAAEWAVGDVYKIVVTGITAEVGGDTAYVPAMVWSNYIVEHADVKAAVDTIEATLGAVDDAAAEGAVTDADTAMAYLKQLVTAAITIAADVVNIDGDAMRGTDSAALASVLGALDDTAAAGAVTDADTVMAYVKQLVTAIITIAGDVENLDGDAMRGTDSAALASVLGALDDATAEGAVTDADTAMAYLKQLVTAIITIAGDVENLDGDAMRGTDSAALASVLGALDSAAASGAVSDAKVVMAYVKQLVTLLIDGTYGLSALQTDVAAIPTDAQRGTDDAALASVLGALNDAAAEGAVTDADTAMAYLKQLVTAIITVASDVENLDGDAMRGTDSAALASVLGALDDAAAEGAVTDADTAMQYVKQIVTLLLDGTYGLSAVQTIVNAIPTTAMRGTDNAALASTLEDAMQKATGPAYNQDTDSLEAISEAVAAIPADAQRGTDDAALASVVGALDDAEASGPVTDADTVMQYVKQLVTAVISILEDTGTDGVVLGSKAAAFGKLAGEDQIAATTEDLNQAAGDYDLFTGTTQPVLLTALTIKMPDDVASDATLTSISVQTDDTTAAEIISSDDGAVANLTAEAEFSWTGAVRINTGTKIQLTINGGAEGAEYITTVTALCKAIADGGYLA